MPCRSFRFADLRRLLLATVGAWLGAGSVAFAQWDAVVRPDRPLRLVGFESEGTDSGKGARREALDAIPMSRLTPTAQQRIRAISSRPTLHRHLGKETIQCDPDLFICLVRNPEILVGIWELMDITHVQTTRLDPYQLRAIDGTGTDCTVDLVYGDPKVHVYIANGFYDGRLSPQKIDGKGLFILRTNYRQDEAQNVIIDGTLDCYLQIDQVAADLILRTFGPLIGRAADFNFAETARFIDQLGLAACRNPQGLEDVALRMPQVSEPTRGQFVSLVRQAAQRYHSRDYTAPARYGPEPTP